MTDIHDAFEVQPDNDKELDLFEHLGELRTRLIRSAVYLCLGSTIAWILYPVFFTFISAPIQSYLSKHHGSFLITGVAEGFLIKMQMSVIIGLIFAVPLLTWELWAFISPGLTRSERRGVRVVAPLSVILFAAGVAAGYWVLPNGIDWLADQNPPGAIFMPSVQQTIIFVLKMCLAFGIVFQMPVILMFLGKIGLITSKMLRTYWKHSIVIISIVAAVVTPSNDAFTMIMMCIPMIILYILSIGLVKLVEKK